MICKKYNLTTPEIFVPKRDIISNVLNKRIKFIGVKVYRKYFRIYVVTNKLVSATSRSKRLFVLLKPHTNQILIIIRHKKYKVYEI